MRHSPVVLRRAGLVLLAAALAACAARAETPLPKLNIDPTRVGVAGLSSGAYMATQTQLAWPRAFVGAALVAGGPYGCADGKLETALGACMKGEPPIDVDVLVARAHKRASEGLIGPLEALAKARVYVLHGKLDGLVAAPVAQASATFYERLRAATPALSGMQVEYDGERAFAHNLPVVQKGDDCEKSTSPYLGHCGFDAAAEIFAHLFGAAPHAVSAASGELRTFAQKPFLSEGKDAFLADSGYAYLPQACLKGQRCGLMIVFHGCKQNAQAVGEAFVRDAGFNRWADAYDVAVIYPQTRSSLMPLNPQACWDWWGYSGADYDTRNGVQQQWLHRLLRALAVVPDGAN
ncbi:MAG: hypothetical protein JSR65_03280 [Proteobacteria bacterium]|nr:hypothetical protein [Pseudomonadota bacterium]